LWPLCALTTNVQARCVQASGIFIVITVIVKLCRQENLLSKFSFSNCQNFPFPNCQKKFLQTVKISLFKLSKKNFSNCQKKFFQTVKRNPVAAQKV
jgi:hypothetical protein